MLTAGHGAPRCGAALTAPLRRRGAGSYYHHTINCNGQRRGDDCMYVNKCYTPGKLQPRSVDDAVPSLSALHQAQRESEKLERLGHNEMIYLR